METTPLDLYITPGEAANLFGITVQGLHKQLKENGIQTKVSKNGRHMIYPTEMRKLLEVKNLTIPSAVIALHIVKGGVGKTTLVHGLASRASAYGFRTLMIDLDQQSNLTTSFGVYSTPKEDPTLMDVTTGNFKGKPLTIQESVVQITDFLHIIPANLTIANLDLVLITGNENIATFFERLIRPIRDKYDLIFIDCPPSLSRVTIAAHCYADKIVLPVNLDRFSIDGLELTLDHLTTLLEKYKVEPDLNIVINKFDARQKILGNAVIDALTSAYRDYLMEAYISVSKQIDNSIAKNQCIWSSKLSKNPALEDLNQLLLELLDLDSWKNQKKKKEPTQDILAKEALLHV